MPGVLGESRDIIVNRHVLKHGRDNEKREIKENKIIKKLISWEEEGEMDLRPR